MCVFCLAQAAKRELERQRQLEWERQRRQELLTQRNREQESIVLLKARKKTLEFELEALVIKHTHPHLVIYSNMMYTQSRQEQILLVNQRDSFWKTDMPYCMASSSTASFYNNRADG